MDTVKLVDKFIDQAIQKTLIFIVVGITCAVDAIKGSYIGIVKDVLIENRKMVWLQVDQNRFRGTEEGIVLEQKNDHLIRKIIVWKGQLCWNGAKEGVQEIFKLKKKKHSKE